MKNRRPAIVMLMLLCASTLDPAHADTAEARFNIAVINAPAKSFFLALIKDTPYNMVVHPDVSGEISLDLKQVTVPEVLEMTRELYGYDYRKLSAGYLVLPATLQTRMFYVNYVDMDRTGSSRTRVTSGQSAQSNGQNGSQNGLQNGSQNGSNALADLQGGQTQSVSSGSGNRNIGGSQTGTVIDTRFKMNFWQALEQSLQELLPKDALHSVVVNAESGVIAVRAMPNELNDVGKFLAKIQSTVGRQVILEAKIIEIDLNHDYQAGVNWSALLSNGNQHYFLGQSSPNTFSSDLLAPSGPTVNVAPGNPVTGLVSSTLGGAFTIAAESRDFASYINLLQVQGNTRVLSSPRVSTLNNQKAIIKSGSDQFFVTNVASNTVSSTVASTSNSIELTSFFSGVSLDVTPQIDDDGGVILHIHPTVSAVTSQNLTVTYAGQTDTLPLALSKIRESDSVVKARSGQIIVIGGLMTAQKSNTNYQTPVLGSIPLVGNLFKSKQTTDDKTELVILLKPIVVGDDNESWKPIVKSGIDHAKKLDPAVNDSMSSPDP
jgi:MSHA biogenesis protein MshL